LRQIKQQRGPTKSAPAAPDRGLDRAAKFRSIRSGGVGGGSPQAPAVFSSGRALPRPGILPSTAGTVGKQKDYASDGIAPITSELDPDAGTYVMRTL
jgi:hypothetical protein